MRNDVCTLIGLIVQESKVTRVEKEIYCRRKSSTRSEFYSAYAVGLRPKFLFEIDPFDWEAVVEQLRKELDQQYCGTEKWSTTSYGDTRQMRVRWS